MHPVTFWLRLFRGYFIELEDHIRWLLEIQEHSTIWASTSLTTWLPLTILIGILTAVGGSSKRPLIVSWPSALDPCLHLLATMSFMRVYIYTYTHTCTHSYSYTYYIVMYLYIYMRLVFGGHLNMSIHDGDDNWSHLWVGIIIVIIIVIVVTLIWRYLGAQLQPICSWKT